MVEVRQQYSGIQWGNFFLHSGCKDDKYSNCTTKKCKRQTVDALSSSSRSEVKQEANFQLAGTSVCKKILLHYPREAEFSIKRCTNQSPRWSLGAKFHQCCHLGCPQSLQCFHGTYQTVRSRCYHPEASQTLNAQNSVKKQSDF